MGHSIPPNWETPVDTVSRHTGNECNPGPRPSSNLNRVTTAPLSTLSEFWNGSESLKWEFSMSPSKYGNYRVSQNTLNLFAAEPFLGNCLYKLCNLSFCVRVFLHFFCPRYFRVYPTCCIIKILWECTARPKTDSAAQNISWSQVVGDDCLEEMIIGWPPFWTSLPFIRVYEVKVFTFKLKETGF